MVDRAAPRVVSGYLAGRSLDPLADLARSGESLRRRTAITAPLFFVKSGSDSDVASAFVIAAILTTDPDPTVHNAVGIFLKHAGVRAPALLDSFLQQHADSMPRAAVRMASEKRRSAGR